MIAQMLTRFRCQMALVVLASLTVAGQTHGSSYPPKIHDDYKRAYAKAIAGDTTILTKSNAQFQDYPLWPDLQAAWYRNQFGKVSDEQIAEFVDAHSALSSVRELRYRWVRSLAKRHQWSMFTTALERHYADTSDPVDRKSRCD